MMRNKSLFIGLTSLVLAALSLCVASHSLFAAPAPGASGYKVIKTVPLGGEGGWDYVYVDSSARRVYISRGTHTVVMSADTYAVEGDIPDTQGVHGIAIASDLGRGFTSNGRTDNVTIFDLKVSLLFSYLNPKHELQVKEIFEHIKEIEISLSSEVNPQIREYERASTTAINAADGTVAGTLALGGKPEFAAADGKGSIFVNNEDTSELIQIDSQKITEAHRWPMAPCKSPSGLSMDTKNRRLYAVCDDKVSVVVNADTGKVVATPEIGNGPDAAAFDPATNDFFASCGEGVLTVIHEDSPDKFTVVENVPTKRSARTMGLDTKTHNIFMPAADFDPPAPGERRGKMKPDSFVIVVVGK